MAAQGATRAHNDNQGASWIWAHKTASQSGFAPVEPFRCSVLWGTQFDTNGSLWGVPGRRRGGTHLCRPQPPQPLARNSSLRPAPSLPLSLPSAAPGRQARTPACAGCSNLHAAIADAHTRDPTDCRPQHSLAVEPASPLALALEAKSHLCPNPTAVHMSGMHKCTVAMRGHAHRRVGGGADTNTP